MSLEPKRASFMRYARVLEILQGDNALSKKLSKNTVAICRPDQTHKEFPNEAVYVTDEIHKQGHDAYTMSKGDITRLATRLLILNPGPIPVPTLPPPPPPPKAKVKAVAKPKPAKPVVAKPVVAKPAAAKPIKPVKVAPPTPPPTPPPVPPKPKVPRRAPAPKRQATADCPPAVEQKNAGEKVVTKPAPVSKPLAFIRPYAPNVVGVAAMCLLQGVLTLMEPFMAAGDPEVKELCQKVNVLLDDLHRRTVLPSVEKEPTTTAS